MTEREKEMVKSLTTGISGMTNKLVVARRGSDGGSVWYYRQQLGRARRRLDIMRKVRP